MEKYAFRHYGKILILNFAMPKQKSPISKPSLSLQVSNEPSTPLEKDKSKTKFVINDKGC